MFQRRFAVAMVLVAGFVGGEAVADEGAAGSDGIELYDPDATELWVKERITHAKKGEREIVRIPVAHASLGWGCDCPDEYIGSSSDTAEGAWLKLKPGPHAALPAAGRFGFVVEVEGYFTGKKVMYKATDGSGEKYEQLVFHVLRSRKLRADDPRLRVVIAGAEAKKRMVPLSDGRPWLTIAASIELMREGGAEEAAEISRRVREAGFPETTVLDSRKAPRLFCCYHVVVVDRFESRKAALAAAKKLKEAGVPGTVASVRRGW